MDKEKYNQIIDEVYEGYLNYPLATIHDHRTNILYQNIDKGWCMLNGRSIISPHPTRHLTQEEFINKCKNNPDFSEKWGLKIEERVLSFNERIKHIVNSLKSNAPLLMEEDEKTTQWLNENSIPTKLITLTYNNETIESYE